MTLAIFDLDNTLIAGDSDHAWGEFLVEVGAVEAELYKEMNDKFYADYQAGELNIYEYLDFSLNPLTQHDESTLLAWREQFIEEKIRPLVHKAAQQKVAEHRDKGDTLLIITATNRFVTEPIAELFGIDNLLAIELEKVDGKYTGKPSGTLSFQEGKIKRLNDWLRNRNEELEGAYFYSDSHNDLPLLELVDFPIVVNGDTTLTKRASDMGWPQISLRDE